LQLRPELAATGIGSLPFIDVAEAVNLVLETFPEIPHWPQLPKRGRMEHFVYQNLTPLVELGLLKVTPEKSWFDPGLPEFTDQITDFYSRYLALEEGDQEALEFFRLPREAAPGFYGLVEAVAGQGQKIKYLKGQIAGPLSVGLNLTDAAQRPAYYDPQLRDLVVKTLASQASWQVKHLSAVKSPALVFVDDPAVYSLGVSTYISLERRQIISDLQEIVDAIHLAGGLAGAHSCAGVDWSLFFESGFDIVAFDAYAFFPSLLGYIDQIRGFLEQGRVLAWGIVPTSYKVMEETTQSLTALLKEQTGLLQSKGISAELLHRQMLLTPSCGTGTLSLEEARRAYHLTAALSRLLRGETK